MKEKTVQRNSASMQKNLFKPQIWIRKYLPKYASEVTEKKRDTDPEIQFLLLSLVRNLSTPINIKLFFEQICIIRKDIKITGSPA
jgi:hypothetical protein